MHARLELMLWAIRQYLPRRAQARRPVTSRGPIKSFELSGHFTTQPDFWNRLKALQNRRDHPDHTQPPPPDMLSA